MRSGVVTGVLILVIGAGAALIALSGGGEVALGPPGRRAPPTVAFGANVNYLFNQGDLRPAQIDAQLTALAATGATVARTDALWEATEPSPPIAGRGVYNWHFDDQIVASLALHGLRWEPIVDYVPGWAGVVLGAEHAQPRRFAAYAAFARALASRYGRGGSFWRERPWLEDLPVGTYEIWNEPDGETWLPAPDPAAYAELYVAARRAVLSVQPRSRVIVGGLISARSFLTAMLASIPALRTHIDGVAIHPYASTPAGVLAIVRGDRTALRTLGMGSVPLYVTEFGWTTSPAGTPGYLPAALRPGYLERTLALLGRSGCGLGSVDLYTWLTPRRDPEDSEDWYGISPPVVRSRPSPDVDGFTAGLRAGGEGAGGRCSGG